MINLSADQGGFYDEVMRWYKGGSQSFVLAGYAGTGKSTLAGLIASEVGVSKTMFCAYTGKAANVLREKGNDANTIHSALYRPRKKTARRLGELEVRIADSIDPREIQMLKNEARKLEDRKFKLNGDTPLQDAKLVIVDEYSMLNETIIADLKKKCRKILYLGDPFQLPPVSGECSLKPDAFMTEIHRQALDNPIIRVSKDIREGKEIRYSKEDGFSFISKREATPELFESADQLIVGKNATRARFNARFRERRGFFGERPVVGDKVICLKNNHRLGLFNGMIDTVTSDAIWVGHEAWRFNTVDFDKLLVWNGDILGEGRYNYENEFHRSCERFDYAYAITCHKSQGSEFDNLVVYNEPLGGTEDRQRWLYTAVTRGKKNVTLVDVE